MECTSRAMEGWPHDPPARRAHRGAFPLSRLLALAALVSVGLVCPNPSQGRNPWPSTRATGFTLPITLGKATELRFGELFVGASPGTCVLTPFGARSSTGGVALGGAFSAGAASFTVGGDPLAAFSVTLPGSATMSSGGADMTLDGFTSEPSGTGQLDALGNQELTIGATLNVGANQAPGSYNGSFSVTVAYN